MNLTKAIHGLDIFRENWCYDNEVKTYNCAFWNSQKAQISSFSKEGASKWQTLM